MPATEALTEMLILAARTLIFYIFVVVVIRIMGKREVGKLSPMDLVVAVMMAEAAVIAIEEPEEPLYMGLIPVVVLMLAELVMSYLSMKYEGLRRLVSGKPTIVIRGGSIDVNEMRRQRYNLDDLLEQLRQKGYPSPADVEFGLLEPSGNLSIVPKAEKRPITPNDLGLKPPRAGLPAILIADGHVETTSLLRIQKSREWLHEQLAQSGYSSPEDVFLGVYLPNGQLFLEPRSTVEKPRGPQPTGS